MAGPTTRPTTRPGDWRQARYAALDFEATGMNPREDEVVQVGLVPVDGDAVALGGAWASWVRPTRAFAGSALTIHGQSFERLADAPPVAAVRPALAARIEGRVLVAHYAELERGFLRRWAIRPAGTVDTLMLALALDGQTTQTARRDAYTLPELAGRFGIDFYGEHDALADAIITAQLFLALASALETAGRARTPRDLMRLSGYAPGFWGGLFG